MKIIYLFLTIFLYLYLYLYFPDRLNLIKNTLQNIGIKLAYNIIYFYGVCQIKCNQIYNYLLPFFKKDEAKTEVILFDISNNTVLKKEYDEDFLKMDFLTPVVILISYSSNINKKILYHIEPEICNQLEPSDIAFIALYLNYNDVRYHINLKTDKYNYYLVGNVINKLFLQYYINVILNNINFVIDDKKSYSLELMDHEVNMIYLDITQSIVIEKNGYHINTIKLEDIKELEKTDNK